MTTFHQHRNTPTPRTKMMGITERPHRTQPCAHTRTAHVPVCDDCGWIDEAALASLPVYFKP